jgi:cell division septal protein FtsQ
MSRNGTRRRIVQRRFRFALIGVIAALAIFTGLFYTTGIEVTGNSRYTDDQIRSMVKQNPLYRNTVLMPLLSGTVHTDAALITKLTVERKDRNTLLVKVTEKYPVGAIELANIRYYFDKDGVVIETSGQDEDGSGITDQSAATSGSGTAVGGEPSGNGDSSTASGSGADGNSEDDDSQAAIQAQSIEENDAQSAIQTVTSASAAADDGSTKKTESFLPSLEDVPLITGLGVTEAKEGEKLKVADDSVFDQILSLVKVLNKLDLQPDSVELDDDLNMTLHFGQIRVVLGSDELLEEKMTRAAAILPQLGGMSGVLHLETYTGATQNIIFDTDES